MIKNDKIRITVTFPKEVMRLLKKQADYEDRSISNMINKIVKEYYDIKSEE